MTQSILLAHLQPVAQTYRRFKLWRGLALCWGGATAGGVLLLLLHALTGWWHPLTTPFLLGAALIGAWGVWVWSRRLAPAYRWVAQQIEQENPRLNTLLLAAIEQKPDAATGELGYLQQRVVEEAIAQDRKEPWKQKNLERLFFAQCSQFVTMSLFASLLVTLLLVAPKGKLRRMESSRCTLAIPVSNGRPWSSGPVSQPGPR